MLKKLSIFALIMSICGVATASMPVMKMNKNFDSNAKEAGKIIYSNIDAKPQTKEIAKLRHDDLGLKDDLRLIQKEQSALRTQLNRTDDGVQQQITDLQQQIIDLQRQIINLQRSCCIQNTDDQPLGIAVNKLPQASQGMQATINYSQENMLQQTDKNPQQELQLLR